MPGLVPGIHVSDCNKARNKEDVDGTSPAMTKNRDGAPSYPKDRQPKDQQDQEDHDEDIEQETRDIR